MDGDGAEDGGREREGFGEAGGWEGSRREEATDGSETRRVSVLRKRSSSGAERERMELVRASRRSGEEERWRRVLYVS
jgi:hypothetical protein